MERSVAFHESRRQNDCGACQQAGPEGISSNTLAVAPIELALTIGRVLVCLLEIRAKNVRRTLFQATFSIYLNNATPGSGTEERLTLSGSAYYGCERLK